MGGMHTMLWHHMIGIRHVAVGRCAIATCNLYQNWVTIVLVAGGDCQCWGQDKAMKSFHSIFSMLLVWEGFLVAIEVYWNHAWSGRAYILGGVLWLQLGAAQVLYGV